MIRSLGMQGQTVIEIEIDSNHNRTTAEMMGDGALEMWNLESLLTPVCLAWLSSVSGSGFGRWNCCRLRVPASCSSRTQALRTLTLGAESSGTPHRLDGLLGSSVSMAQIRVCWRRQGAAFTIQVEWLTQHACIA
jgi:hypothetical protein